MSDGPDKPDAVEVSQGEKIQAQLAKDQINYYRSTYAPLEGQYAQEAGRDYSSRLSGQAGSAGMREATPGLQQMALSSAPVDTARIGSAIGTARTAAAAQGRRTRDDGRLSALGVGLGVTADAGASLTSAGRGQTNSTIDAVSTEMAKQQARSSTQAAIGGAVGTLAGAGLTYYGLKSSMAPKATMTTLDANNANSLGDIRHLTANSMQA